MVVIDRAVVVVLVVPAKGRETHAHVEPRRDDAGDVLLDESQERALIEVVQVPPRTAVG